jgi:inositol transport system substrate-binding protein
MKHFLIAFTVSAILMTSAMAQKIGVSLTSFDHLFLVTVREAMAATAKELGVDIQLEDAQGDIGKQLNQIQNFVAQKVDAIIVNPVDTAATPKMTKLAIAAGIPLVYVTLSLLGKPCPRGSSTLAQTRTCRGSSRVRRSPGC